jgi:hypothetical protein
MQVSEAQLAANRRNALRSSGPKTTEGKASSRRNGLKHGLSGEGVCVPESNAAEVARRAEALEADLQPRSPLGALMIHRLARLSVRMETAAEREHAAIAKKVRHALADHDEALEDAADLLFEGLAEEPRKNLRKLKRTPVGVDRLIEAWSDLLDNLARNLPSAWTEKHLDQLALLMGKKAETAADSVLGALARAMGGDFLGLSPKDGAALADDARRAWARDRLAERIKAEIAALEAHRASLDHDAFEQDRVEAPTMALFDPSKEATLARRYESEASRGFFKALKEFRQAEAEFLEREQAAESALVASPSPSLGSSREMAAAPDLTPPRDPWATPSASFATANGPDGGLLSVGRAPQPVG